jgi:hypothetical protein
MTEAGCETASIPSMALMLNLVNLGGHLKPSSLHYLLSKAGNLPSGTREWG